MGETLEDLTVNYEENGRLLVKELDKVPLTKGTWATVIFRYQQLNPETDEYGPDKYVIQRYKKVGGEYRRQSKFAISSAKQARQLVDILSSWLTDQEDEDEIR